MDEKWEPNQEYLQTLISMGISHNIATEVSFLYIGCTKLHTDIHLRDMIV